MGKPSGKRTPASGHRRSKKSTKQRLRDVERLLRRDDLPATVRSTQERMLTMLQRDLKDRDKQHREEKMQKKYRMVRFFEKRKLLRKLKSARQLSTKKASTGEENEHLQQLAQIKEDFNYVVHYPVDVKYIALFPAKGSTTSDASLQLQHEIRCRIVADIAGGKLEDAAQQVLDGTTVSNTTGAGVKKRPKRLRTRLQLEDDSADELPPSQHVEEDGFFVR